MKKSIYAFALTSLSVLCLNFTAFAADINKSIKLTSAELKENVVAVVTDENGVVTSMDVEVVMTELPSLLTKSGTLDRRYSMAVYASTPKSESNSSDVNKSDKGIQASGYLCMEWTDVEGTKNTIDSLEGKWGISQGKNLLGTVKYGGSHARPSKTVKDVGNAFDISASYTAGLSGSLHACYFADLHGVDSKGNATSYLASICVYPSIID